MVNGTVTWAPLAGPSSVGAAGTPGAGGGGGGRQGRQPQHHGGDQRDPSQPHVALRLGEPVGPRVTELRAQATRRFRDRGRPWVPLPRLARKPGSAATPNGSPSPRGAPHGRGAGPPEVVAGAQPPGASANMGGMSR